MSYQIPQDVARDLDRALADYRQGGVVGARAYHSMRR